MIEKCNDVGLGQLLTYCGVVWLVILVTFETFRTWFNEEKEDR